MEIVVVISTEPYLLVDDLRPFSLDLGSKIYLRDFNREQVQGLNFRYRNPLDEKGLNDIFDFFGGHPYLTQRAFYTILTETMTSDKLIKIASSNDGPFSKYMKNYLVLLQKESNLRTGIKQLLKNRFPREDSYHRLWQIGLVTGDDRNSCAFRCKFHRDYFYSRFR